MMHTLHANQVANDTDFRGQLYQRGLLNNEKPEDRQRLRLICNQTKGGDYSSDPTRYHFDSEREAVDYFTNRGHGEGLTNWLAYSRLCDAGYMINVEMVER